MTQEAEAIDPAEWHGLTFERVRDMWREHAGGYRPDYHRGTLNVPIRLAMAAISWEGPYANPFLPSPAQKVLRFSIKHEIQHDLQLQREAVYCGGILIDAFDVGPLQH